MLQRVSIGRQGCAPCANVENYRALVGDQLVDEIETLGHDLKDVRIAHVNSTAFGGGVAELLARHLPVPEALWKETPVVAGRAGGIPMQFPSGFDRYLVDSVEACAAEVVHLLGRAGARGEFGRAGREHVRRRFLLPRLVRDELALVKRLV